MGYASHVWIVIRTHKHFKNGGEKKLWLVIAEEKVTCPHVRPKVVLDIPGRRKWNL